MKQLIQPILFSENIHALLPANHPLAKSERINLVDLRNDNFVLFPEGYILHKVAVDACQVSWISPNDYI